MYIYIYTHRSLSLSIYISLSLYIYIYIYIYTHPRYFPDAPLRIPLRRIAFFPGSPLPGHPTPSRIPPVFRDGMATSSESRECTAAVVLPS